MKTKRKIYLGIGIVIITLLIFIGQSFAAPVLSWAPDSINRSIPQGEEKSVIAIFSSNKNLGKVEVWLTPKLRPYLTVSPINFENINKNSGYTLTLNFSIPLDAPTAVYKGTLHIRNAEKNSKTYSKPLPINLEITPAGSDYVEPIGMPTPEEALSCAAKAIEDGDIEEALKMYSESAHNKMRDLLNLLDSIERERLAESLKNATLDNEAEAPPVDNFRTYKTEMLVNGMPDGSLFTVHFHIIKLPNDNWVIM